MTAFDPWTVFGRGPNGFYVARWSPDELRAELWSWDLASHVTVTARSTAVHRDPSDAPAVHFTEAGDAVAGHSTWMATVPASGAAAANLVEGGDDAGKFVAFDGDRRRALFLRTIQSGSGSTRNYVESHAIADGQREASTELPSSDVRFDPGSAFNGYALFAQSSPRAWFVVKIEDATSTLWTPAFCAGSASCELPHLPPFAGVRSEAGLPRSLSGGWLVDVTGDPKEPVRVVGGFNADYNSFQTDSALFLLHGKGTSSELVPARTAQPITVSTLPYAGVHSHGEARGSVAVLRSATSRKLQLAHASGTIVDMTVPPSAAADSDVVARRFSALSCSAPSSDGGAYLVEQPFDAALAPAGPTVVWKLTEGGAPQQVSTIAWATPASGALRCDFVETSTGIIARVRRGERFPGNRTFEQAIVDLH